MKTYRKALSILFLFSFFAVAEAQPNPNIELTIVEPERVGFSSERLQRINDMIQHHVKGDRISGAVTLVARKGNVVHFKAHGLMEIFNVFVLLPGVSYGTPSLSAVENPLHCKGNNGLVLVGPKIYSSPSEAAIDNGIVLICNGKIIAGIQHFIFLEFVASLIPEWFPGDAIFWTYFGGIALIAAGTGLFIPQTARWATQLYADARGVFRVYQMSFDGTIWKLWRDAPSFNQRFEGALSEDGKTITAYWEASEDGKNWNRDFDLIYTKIKDS